MFEIKLGRQAEKFLRICEKNVFDQIVSKLKGLMNNPTPHDVKRLIGYDKPTFRIRIGKHRILYRINYESKLVIIVKIDKRSKVYK